MDFDNSSKTQYTSLPFPPVTKSHILNCSYHSWHPRYRTITPKARLIPLTPPFLSYLRADGIVLPPDDDNHVDWSDSDSGIFSSAENENAADSDEDEDPAAQWRGVHNAIKATITELGGKVVPKLNWSAPKDATWINATNSMDCRTPADVYLLLKSSDFVTHDLEHAFDGCSEVAGQPDDGRTVADIPYHLVLRKHVLMNPSVEFRCFVRRGRIIGICQRDLNHFDFLFNMQDSLRDKIEDFFEQKIRDTFPDENFAFDVYIPPPHERVWLVDINPWAPRTDPLLFSWMELLTMPGPPSSPGQETVRIPLHSASTPQPPDQRLNDITSSSEYPPTISSPSSKYVTSTLSASESDSGSESELEEDIYHPEFRLIRRDDPEAYSFSTPQYSAHKLPKDVVDASQGGEGPLREFAAQWKDLLAKERQKQEDEGSEDSEGD